MCPIWQPRSLKPLEFRRATRTKDAEATVEISPQLNVADEAVVAEGKAMVGVVGEEAKVMGAPMPRSSMYWNAKTLNDASTLGI